MRCYHAAPHAGLLGVQTVLELPKLILSWKTASIQTQPILHKYQAQVGKTITAMFENHRAGEVTPRSLGPHPIAVHI